jgi:alkanesulfonate monooxygenase SsuD/methylene tetrahydromethanopterin reductase-like flavin-dependent oxidoreductase (luciferase family)
MPASEEGGVADWRAHPWVTEGGGRVRFGLYGGLSADWARNVERVQLADELGFDSFWIADHPISHGRDPWSYLAGLAAVTRRIRLGTQVTSANYRPLALLARIVADVDRISGGRVVLGIGIGDDPRDSARLGVPYPPVAERQAALDDALRLLRPMLAGEEVALPGGESVLLKPGPAQARVPILIAGGGEKVTLRQVAEHADASNFGAGGPIGNAWTLDDVRRKYAVLREHCRAIDRPYESVLRTYAGGLFGFGEGVETREEYLTSGLGHRYLVLRADPAGAIAYYRALAETGVQYVILTGLDDPVAVRLFAERVAPAFA